MIEQQKLSLMTFTKRELVLEIVGCRAYEPDKHRSSDPVSEDMDCTVEHDGNGKKTKSSIITVP